MATSLLVQTVIANLRRKLAGEISQKELERLNREANKGQLSLGIKASTDEPRRTP